MKHPAALAVFAPFLLGAAAHAAPPVLKASVEEPVVEELMGGCSLRCAFVWSVEVQVPGRKPTAMKLLHDERAGTAWVAAEGSSGVGVKFKFVLPKKLHPEIDGNTPLYGLDIINGRCQPEEQWKSYGRVKRARLYYNDKPFRDLVFADSRRWQRVLFPDIYVRSGDSMVLELLEIYPGQKGAGAAITEFVLQGAH